MPVKAIIFDLDGTLLHSIVDIADACNHVLEQNNLPTHDTESYVSWIGNGAAKLVERALPDHIKSDPEKLEYFIQEYKDYYLAHLMIKSHLYDGIDEVLAFLKQHKIPFAVNTNKPHSQTVPIVENYMKDFLPDQVFGQQDHIPKKPDPFAAKLIAKNFEVENQEVLFVGDSYVDIKTGKAAGMQTLGVTWGYGKLEPMKEAGCSDFIATTSELMEFLKLKIEE
ncbi:HAD-IA family hydrolase [Maribellus sp. YY47]|uniref:HAD family hydrolase n=1 Tax=Maribellus sp. YY47 TaxID=2929486 RepID=UPI002000E4EC|nr:HAD-IA family hydrolase [Maribellus sp. YY47]MCK3682722.1 HAD-IA family hydrolase [Maribellus sp. YY47]